MMKAQRDKKHLKHKPLKKGATVSGEKDTKPSYDEWMYWTQVVVDRLVTITHVYGHPPHEDVFMPEKERQDKLREALILYRQLHELTDRYELAIPQDAPDVLDREESLIANLQPIFREVLAHLSLWSDDMQLLLKTSWVQASTKLAQNLFHGPDGCQAEGIGSGLVENGHLPAMLTELLDREIAGGARESRVEKPRMAGNRLRREELARLWVKKNSAFLRSAGRVD